MRWTVTFPTALKIVGHGMEPNWRQIFAVPLGLYKTLWICTLHTVVMYCVSDPGPH
jgi:hypothetical protein